MTAAAPLDTVREFPTPEHIAFRFRLAGPLARAAAYVIDLFVRGLALGALAVAAFLVGREFGIGIALLASFAIDWLSGALCEWLWHGRTPGKAIVGIRVAGVDGLPAGFAACLLRNLLRWADWLPSGFALGLSAMALSPSFQRLGDLAAGTLVIYDRRRRTPRIALPDAATRASAEALPAELVAAIDAQAARAVALYALRRRRYAPARRAEIARHLAGPLAQRFALAERDPDALLCALHHRLNLASGATGMAARAAALLAERRADWKRLEDLASGGRGAHRQAGELARLYRAACADLALAEAYHLPRGEVDRLHELVAHAHLRFYRRVAVPWRRLVWLAFTRVPAQLYGDGCLRVALVCFYGLFAGCALLAWWDPEIAHRYLGARLDDLREMYASSPDGRGLGDGATMYGFYVRNNVGIALGSFAAGVFVGLGSLVTLVFNGLYLGLCFGAMAATTDASREHFFAFTAAHGPFELTGITLAGAAGLRLGLGLVVTRGRPRLEALRRAALDAVPIMAVAAVMVAAAAPIEAFLSPSPLPTPLKRIVGVLCAVLVVGYLVGLGRRGRRLGAHRDLDDPGQGTGLRAALGAAA